VRKPDSGRRFLRTVKKYISLPGVRILNDKTALAEALSDEFESASSRAAENNRKMCVALSGGSTPALFFRSLAARAIDWESIHFYWGDERCVPPENIESNYLMTTRELLDRIQIPPENIHRVRGETDPDREAERYAREITRNLPSNSQGIPVFDWIILGLGDDGHTASIFPGFKLRPSEGSLCAVAGHPETGQERITFTLPLINSARRVSFLVSGEGKSGIVASIVQKTGDYLQFPAAHVLPQKGILEWFLDREAGSGIS